MLEFALLLPVASDANRVCRLQIRPVARSIVRNGNGGRTYNPTACTHHPFSVEDRGHVSYSGQMGQLSDSHR